MVHCKKRLAIFLSPIGMSLTKLSLGRNNKIFPLRESLVSDNPTGDENIENLFLRCTICALITLWPLSFCGIKVSILLSPAYKLAQGTSIVAGLLPSTKRLSSVRFDVNIFQSIFFFGRLES
jgi:hypothetical protein